MSLTRGTTITAATKRSIDHIFLRPGSKFWRVRLQMDGKSVEKSLRVTDRDEARVLAGPLVTEHRAKLLAARAPEGVEWRQEYAPGLHDGPDGGKIFATATELHYMDATGKITSKGSNGGFGTLRSALPAPNARPAYADKSDDALFDTYVADAGLTGYPKTEAERMWHLFKTVVGKPLAKCTREDGKALVKHMEDADDPPKSATLLRRMVYLIATVNLAIRDSKHVGVNPFVSCVVDRDDEVERDPFNDNDIKLMKANLHKLSEQDQLLLRVLATMGVRRSEAYQIASEETENGIRNCVVGADKGMARHRIPFPKDLLPHLDKPITKPLFTGRADNAGKRIREWLTDIGVIDDKDGRDIAPAHSFRHRAAQRMRAANILEDVREAIGGWANGKGKKVSRKYGNKHGAGYPISVLRKAIDRIGF